jgi:hypothetical protein
VFSADQPGLFELPLDPLIVSATAINPNMRMNGIISPVITGPPVAYAGGGGGGRLASGCAARLALPSATSPVGLSLLSIIQALGACGAGEGAAATAAVELAMNAAEAVSAAINFVVERISMAPSAG